MMILLCEDNISLSRAITAILKKNNYAVETVFNGSDALDYMKCGVYDCVLLDIMMPGRDGISALKEARAAGFAAPVILLTAKSEISDKVTGLDSGANDYITKPFAPEELLARIRAATRQGSAPDSTLTMGNTKLNRSTFELYTPIGNYRLTGKEYQIMEMLMLTPSRPASSESILTHVWGLDSGAEPNAVWVYISYLRKKLRALESDVRITAFRNEGYILENGR